MKGLVRMLVGIIVLGFIVLVQNAFAWHVKVINDAPMKIKAQCKKVGVIGVGWNTIEPAKSDECGCGGADCPKGVKISVPGVKVADKKGKQETLEFSTDWPTKCGNITVRVLPIPQWEIKGPVDPFNQSTLYTLKGFKFGVSRSFNIPDQPLNTYNP